MIFLQVCNINNTVRNLMTLTFLHYITFIIVVAVVLVVVLTTLFACVCMCLCMYVCICLGTWSRAFMWKSVDNLQESVFSLWIPGVKLKVVKLDIIQFHPLSLSLVELNDVKHWCLVISGGSWHEDNLPSLWGFAPSTLSWILPGFQLPAAVFADSVWYGGFIEGKCVKCGIVGWRYRKPLDF